MTASSSGAAVELQDVSVRYRVPHERYFSFKEFAIRWLQRRVEYVDFWALRDVCLEVQPGEAVGVIGVNGAGKSTLLRTVARVLHPAEGRVVVRGSIAPMLELGTGFHSELTGRENVFLYGSLLGYTSQQIEEMYESILAFSGLEEFIDAPLRTYSTGMVARLGFAVATARYADIFLVDEVLSVGDEAFQRKCIQRIESYRRQGATILFVSHSMGTVQEICQRVVWLDGGQVMQQGAPEDIIPAYLRGTDGSG
ncbi:MAG: ABC transporter ATP-binding protein [Anaerolineales bacterium]|nr:ABC transporter ATP-binding protein [Anaerolineales bacterium]